MSEKDQVAVHVDAAEKRPELPEYDRRAPCPHCGGETQTGVGLAGGGFGIYAYCEACGVVTSKSVTDD